MPPYNVDYIFLFAMHAKAGCNKDKGYRQKTPTPAPRRQGCPVINSPSAFQVLLRIPAHAMSMSWRQPATFFDVPWASVVSFSQSVTMLFYT